jgi:hypothetical protein
VRLPLSSVEQFAVADDENAPNPEPQSNEYVKPAATSALEGSDAPATDRAMPEPSATEVGAVSVAVGATLVTVTDALYSVTPPSLSRIRPRTVRVPSSLVAQLAVFPGA